MTELRKNFTAKSYKTHRYAFVGGWKVIETTICSRYKELAEQFEKADNITLFRTLKTFLEHKLIHTIDDGTGVVKYALCQSGCSCNPSEQHTHFHCSQCKRTFCLTDAEIPNINIPLNFKLEGINLVLKEEGVTDAIKIIWNFAIRLHKLFFYICT